MGARGICKVASSIVFHLSLLFPYFFFEGLSVNPKPVSAGLVGQ